MWFAEEPLGDAFDGTDGEIEELREALHGWAEMREEKGKAHKITTLRTRDLALMKLAKVARDSDGLMPPTARAAVEFVNDATMRGWKSFFPPDRDNGRTKRTDPLADLAASPDRPDAECKR